MHHIIDTTPSPAERWTASQADILARLAAELRSAAAALEHGGPAGRARTTGGEGARTVTIGLAEARALLRAIEPHTLSIGGRGSRTSRLVASLAAWWQRWARLSLTPAYLEVPAAIEAGLQLRLDLGDWLTAMRWHQATTRARVSWPQPTPAAVAINAILRQSTDAEANTPGTPPRPRRRPAAIAGQRTLLLPIAGSGKDASTAEAAATPLFSGQGAAA